MARNPKKDQKAPVAPVPPAEEKLEEGGGNERVEKKTGKPAAVSCKTCSNEFRTVVHKSGLLDDGGGFVLHKQFDADSKAGRQYDYLAPQEKLPLFIQLEPGKKPTGDFAYHSFSYNGLGISVKKGVYVYISRDLAVHLQESFQQTSEAIHNVKVSGSEHGTVPANLADRGEDTRGALNA